MSFQIIPAVDIQQGRAVRLFEGDPKRETVYYESPLDAAKHWFTRGADWLHLVDLDAALGKGNNQAIIREIAQLGCHVEVGGGIRDVETASTWLKLIDRVVLGTAAVTKPELVDALIEQFGTEKVVVSVDAKAGKVAVKGWQEISDVYATDLATRIADQGVRVMIYTDISRDGTMQGVDAAPVEALRASFPHTLIAGGGVASDKDLDLYEVLGLEGAIVGRALYEGTVRYPRIT
ncbi:MAG: 1-(5-phosphoribosyl)-5-[(5-phosphoribosylamino)methylideneamino]imidazole-4-carboxamide isomerase [Deinococcota bacterium]